jgi:hypothetical protein
MMATGPVPAQNLTMINGYVAAYSTQLATAMA